MAFYNEMADMALEMIEEFGQPAVLRSAADDAYDPDTGSTTPGTVTEQIASCIVSDFTGQEFQNNSLIKQGDKKVKIPAQGLVAPALLSKVICEIEAPNIYDYFTRPYSTLTVMNVKEVSPAGIPIIYEIQGRR
jgi:hypothetical protein